MPPVLATVNWAWVIAGHALRWMAVGEIERIAGAGVAVAAVVGTGSGVAVETGVGAPPREDEVLGIAVPPGWGVPVGVCCAVDSADVLFTWEASSDVKGARTIGTAPRGARAANAPPVSRSLHCARPLGGFADFPFGRLQLVGPGPHHEVVQREEPLWHHRGSRSRGWTIWESWAACAGRSGRQTIWTHGTPIRMNGSVWVPPPWPWS